MKRVSVIASIGLLCLGMLLWCPPKTVFADQPGGTDRAQSPHSPDRYDVVWESPSEGPSGSMPLGNGDVALNAWIEANGDLVFYISKTDSWGDNGRLLKVGRVRVSLNPRANGDTSYTQVLHLHDATLKATWGDHSASTTVQLWVDANRPVIHVDVDSAQPTVATAHIELWRTERLELKSLEVSDVMLDRSRPDKRHERVFVEPDVILTNRKDRIGWYHHNTKSVGPTVTAKIQGLADFQRPDPLLHRTFGAIIRSGTARRIDDQTLATNPSNSHHLSVYVLTKQPATPNQWLQAVDRLIAGTESITLANQRADHEAWWARFWDRSWIDITRGDEAPLPSIVPANDHAVRVGIDQQNQNRFKGVLGRVSIFDTPLDDRQVQRLAKLAHDESLPDRAHVLYSAVPKPATTLADSQSWDWASGGTFEAWINPEKLPGGGARIIDKVTAGRGDGLLLDTYPGNSLRLIVGNVQLNQPNAAPPARWTHVTAVLDHVKRNVRLYVNGRQVAQDHLPTADSTLVVSQKYALQRFINACAGRGHYPIKFNGSLFTVPYAGRPGDADYRRWGPGYWWQNTRLPYISMCASGDFDMMQPLFHMYVDQLMPLHKYRTRRYLGHDGAFIPECIYFWGDIFSETYGWKPFEQREDKLQESGYHKWEWVSGPELVWMMLDYYEYTQDESFLRDKLLPTAHEVITFFDQQYGVGADGKLVMHPAQALETWWDCTNPMPEIAGLRAIVGRLLGLPERLTSRTQRAAWQQFQKKIPDLPTREVDGVRMLAPAGQFAMKHNIENPELYAVFPFRLVAFEKDNAPLGIEALRHRENRGNVGWRQEDIFMAYLGLADDAREYVVGRARNYDHGSRFPAFWGPNYDWVPDQDHGGILLRAVQSMLLQSDGKKLFLLPAWPKDWNVHFKLHAPYQTVVQCRYRDGKIERLEVTPESRRADVVTCK